MERRQRIRPQCPQCGSRRFRRDPNTSLVVCAYGHVLQSYRQEETDAGEEYSTAGASQSLQRRRRRVRKERNFLARKGTAARVNVKEWRGQRGRYHYTQCLQLLLRKQVAAVREAYTDLPDTFETVCREIWMYYISLFDDVRPPPYSDEEEIASNGKASRISDLDALLEEEQSETERFERELKDIGVSDEPSSASDTEREGRRSGAGSALEDDSDSGFRSVRSWRSNTPTGARETGMDTLLGIVYLALVYVRVPIMWTDLRSLALEKRLPFLNAVYDLPTEMADRLSFVRASRLDVIRVQSVTKLHRRTLRLADRLNTAFDIVFPELNVLPLLWRCTERFLLPATFYRAAKRLLSYLEIPLHPVSFLAASDNSLKVDRTALRRQRMHPKPPFASDKRLTVSQHSQFSVAREVVLISALVLVAKLRYGLDGEDRLEDAEREDYWSGAPPTHAWLETLREANARLTHTDRRLLSEPNDDLGVLDMDAEQLDTYLDFVEASLLFNEHPSAFRNRDRSNALRDLETAVEGLEDRDDNADRLSGQPIDRIRTFSDRLYSGDHPLAPTQVGDLPSDALRPGEAHSVYTRIGTKHISPAGSELVHPSYATVLHHAALIVDCQPEEVSDTVCSLENQLVKKLEHRHRIRRKPPKQRRKTNGNETVEG